MSMRVIPTRDGNLAYLLSKKDCILGYIPIYCHSFLWIYPSEKEKTCSEFLGNILLK